jgi:O-acetyl-ADP-ribose deacetylase (regulator of RNase III)
MSTTKTFCHQQKAIFKNRLFSIETYNWKFMSAIESIALPKIGAGLGKLDLVKDVRPLMINHLTDGETQYVVYEEVNPSTFNRTRSDRLNHFQSTLKYRQLVFHRDRQPIKLR